MGHETAHEKVTLLSQSNATKSAHPAQTAKPLQPVQWQGGVTFLFKAIATPKGKLASIYKAKCRRMAHPVFFVLKLELIN